MRIMMSMPRTAPITMPAKDPGGSPPLAVEGLPVSVALPLLFGPFVLCGLAEVVLRVLDAVMNEDSL